MSLPPPLPPGLSPTQDSVGALAGLLASIDAAHDRYERLDDVEQLALMRQYRVSYSRLLEQVRDAWISRAVSLDDADQAERLREFCIAAEMIRQDQRLVDMESVSLNGARKRLYLSWGLYDMACKLDRLIARIVGRESDPARKEAASTALAAYTR